MASGLENRLGWAFSDLVTFLDSHSVTVEHFDRLTELMDKAHDALQAWDEVRPQE